MSTFTQYGDITPRTNLFAVVKFLSHAVPKLVLERYAEVFEMPKNKTLTIKFRRCVPFDITTTPLAEGVTPSPDGIQIEDVFTVLRQYGRWVGLTDVIADTHEDPVMNKQMELMGELAAQTRELLLWGTLRGGTNVYFGSTASSPTLRTQVNAPINLQLQRKITTFLEAQYAKKITKMLAPSQDIATQPVEEGYVAVCHTNLDPDIRDMPGFIHRARYASGSPEPEELGTVEQVRYVKSALLQPFLGAGSTTLSGMRNSSGAVDVYPIIYFGQEAYGVVPLRGMQSAEIHMLNPNRQGGDSGDPLAQRGHVGFKMWFASLRLNENWLVRAEVGATA